MDAYGKKVRLYYLLSSSKILDVNVTNMRSRVCIAKTNVQLLGFPVFNSTCNIYN